MKTKACTLHMKISTSSTPTMTKQINPKVNNTNWHKTAVKISNSIIMIRCPENILANSLNPKDKVLNMLETISIINRKPIITCTWISKSTDNRSMLRSPNIQSTKRI